MNAGPYVGRSIRRVEDHRLLTGQGCYVADRAIEGDVHMVVVRSPYPHADIIGIDTSTACAMQGVLGVWTGHDVIADGLGAIPWERLPPAPKDAPHGVPPEPGDPAIAQPQPILARSRVLYLGEPVATVVAETLAQAKDAAEAVIVDYAEHQPLIDVRSAASPGAGLIWEQASRNVCFRTDLGDPNATTKAFSKAAHITTVSIENERLVQNPMETRGYIGLHDAKTNRFTLYASAGKPQNTGRALARDIFHLPEDSICVVAKDVGGGFGAKNPLYPEQALVLWTARMTGRPVRWHADRSECFLSDYQGRGQATDAECAFDSEGRILALRVRVLADLGAYLGQRGSTAANMWRTMGTSVYDIQTIDFDLRGIHTNRVPTCPYRGAGAPEAIFILERLLDTAAGELNLSPDEIRRRNLIPASAMPYRTQGVSTYDSGDFAANMDAAESLADTESFAKRRHESEARGLKRGLGYANLVEACGAGIADRADISVTPDGQVTIRIGTMSNGQSHETVYAQMLADKLGIDIARIGLVQGDSNETPWGMGTGASRSMTVGGSALVRASDELIENGLPVAAELLEAASQDIEYEQGHYRIRGTDRLASLEEVAARVIADGAPADRGLEASHRYIPQDSTYPSGCHIAEVEVDPETGAVMLLRYSIAHDVGLALNPMVVEGQLTGGVAQGVGQALLESNIHDPQSGQLLSGSFMDCGMPRAHDLPNFETQIVEIPCTHTPTGAKSVGEAGPTGAPAAVINAIVDALAPLGVRHIPMPATPEAVYRAIRDAQR